MNGWMDGWKEGRIDGIVLCLKSSSERHYIVILEYNTKSKRRFCCTIISLEQLDFLPSNRAACTNKHLQFSFFLSYVSLLSVWIWFRVDVRTCLIWKFHILFFFSFTMTSVNPTEPSRSRNPWQSNPPMPLPMPGPRLWLALSLSVTVVNCRSEKRFKHH